MGWRSQRSEMRDDMLQLQDVMFIIVNWISSSAWRPLRVPLTSRGTCATGCPFNKHAPSSNPTENNGKKKRQSSSGLFMTFSGATKRDLELLAVHIGEMLRSQEENVQLCRSTRNTVIGKKELQNLSEWTKLLISWYIFQVHNLNENSTRFSRLQIKHFNKFKNESRKYDWLTSPLK